MKRYNKIISFICIVALVLSFVPTCVGADDEPLVSVNSPSVYVGSTTTVSVSAANFTDIAAFECSLYYDKTVFEVVSTSIGSTFTATQNSINTDNPGEVAFNFATFSGITGSGTMFSVTFRALSTAAIGYTPLVLTIGRVFNTDSDAVTVGKTNGSVKVMSQGQTASEFYLASSLTASTLKKGDKTVISIKNNYRRSFAALDISVNYDSEYLNVVSASFSTDLTSKENAVYSINTDQKGIARCLFTTIENISSYDLLTIEFEAIKNEATTTDVTAEVNAAITEDGSYYKAGKKTTTLICKYVEPAADFPDLYLDSTEAKIGGTFTSTLKLEAGAGLAAGDFKLTYDPDVILCTGVEKAATISDNGGMVVIDPTFNEGIIKFSYVNTSGYAGALDLVNISWQVVTKNATSYDIALSGSDVCNLDFKKVNLEYVPSTEAIGFAYGDANGDGKVDSSDLTRLRKYLASYDYKTKTYSMEIFIGGDANGDGNIDSIDLTRMRKYFASYDYKTKTYSVVLGPQ